MRPILEPYSSGPYGRSIASEQIEAAINTDPHHGRCLLTNTKAAIEVCRLLEDVDQSSLFVRLEWAWGMHYHTLDLDTPHNLLFLRADWRRLLDSDEYLLVPERKCLERLEKYTGLARQCGDKRPDINRVFSSENYKYHLIPLRLREPLCRFVKDRCHDHKTHYHPYHTLGPLVSHVKPHFVVCNSAGKLHVDSIDFYQELLDRRLALEATSVATKSLDVGTPKSEYPHLKKIVSLWLTWTTTRAPMAFGDGFSDGVNDGGHHIDGDEDDSDSVIAVSEFGSEIEDDGDRNHGDEVSQAHAGAATRKNKNKDVVIAAKRKQQRTASSDIDDAPDYDFLEQPDYINRMAQWVEKCEQDKDRGGGWESLLTNDDEVICYRKEVGFQPLLADRWYEWRPEWILGRRRGEVKTRLFSSNDWAVFKREVYLPLSRR
ncbi:hypothetical protein J3A83DRAFT_4368138 [Scleroderma citrinum]